MHKDTRCKRPKVLLRALAPQILAACPPDAGDNCSRIPAVSLIPTLSDQGMTCPLLSSGWSTGRRDARSSTPCQCQVPLISPLSPPMYVGQQKSEFFRLPLSHGWHRGPRIHAVLSCITMRRSAHKRWGIFQEIAIPDWKRRIALKSRDQEGKPSPYFFALAFSSYWS